MLFRKRIDPRCQYCRRGVRLQQDEVGCHIRGIVPAYWHCRKFRYDPLKRQPPPPGRLSQNYKPEDFKL